jgi:hypothetical protein
LLLELLLLLPASIRCTLLPDAEDASSH